MFKSISEGGVSADEEICRANLKVFGIPFLLTPDPV